MAGLKKKEGAGTKSSFNPKTGKTTTTNTTTGKVTVTGGQKTFGAKKATPEQKAAFKAGGGFIPAPPKEKAPKHEGITFNNVRKHISKEGGQAFRDAVAKDASQEELAAIIAKFRTDDFEQQIPSDFDSVGLFGVNEELQKKQQENLLLAEEAKAEQLDPAGFNKPFTLASLGKVLGLGALIGAAAISAGTILAGFGAAATTATATAGTSIPKVATAAAGIQKATKAAKAGQLATNTKNVTKTLSYFAKLAKKAKSPSTVVGILGVLAYTSTFWGPNEKGDALTSLGLAQKEALRSGQYDMVAEIHEAIEEANAIKASTPVVGFVKSELAKFNALRLTSKTNMQSAIKQQQGTTPQQIRDAKFEARNQ